VLLKIALDDTLMKLRRQVEGEDVEDSVEGGKADAKVDTVDVAHLTKREPTAA
jgi:hypothetical protein